MNSFRDYTRGLIVEAEPWIDMNGRPGFLIIQLTGKEYYVSEKNPMYPTIAILYNEAAKKRLTD